MRTFNTIMAACLAAVSLMATACGGDDNCTGVPGCTVPPTCGDNTCRADLGETAQNCPEDCVPATCGNGICDQQESALNCAEDCAATCVADPQLPQYCPQDGHCWPDHTDCTLPVHACNGVPFRCGDAAHNWNCCSGSVVLCPDSNPFWCASQNTCTRTAELCPGGGGSCETWGRACTAP